MKRFLGVAVLIGSGMLGVAHAEELGDLACGNPFKNHYGPFDYRAAGAQTRETVEMHHFTPTVETLKGGQTSMGPGGDLSYTLNVFPNHPRALMSMSRFAIQKKMAKPPGSLRTMACWFDRAERFRPDDAVVKMIHGVYLLQMGETAAAVPKLEEARKLDGGDPNVSYNLGLAYFSLKRYDDALASAHRAYTAGFPLPGLRDKLKRVGKWREPASTGAPAVNPPNAPSSVEATPPAPVQTTTETAP